MDVVFVDTGFSANPVLVGGTIDCLGWAEFVWDADGAPIGSNATLPDETDPEWLSKGREALGRSLY